MLQNICQMYILEDLDMILFETLFILLNNLLLISFYLMGFYSSKANIRTLLIVPINLVHILFSYSYSRRYVLKRISDFYSLLPQGLRVFSYKDFPCRFLILTEEKISNWNSKNCRLEF